MTGVSTYTISLGATVDLGYHLFCAISGMQGDPTAGNMQVWSTGSPNRLGQYDWIARNLNTGEFWAPTIEISCFA
jgi:hypothetical protein